MYIKWLRFFHQNLCHPPTIQWLMAVFLFLHWWPFYCSRPLDSVQHTILHVAFLVLLIIFSKNTKILIDGAQSISTLNCAIAHSHGYERMPPLLLESYEQLIAHFTWSLLSVESASGKKCWVDVKANLHNSIHTSFFKDSFSSTGLSNPFSVAQRRSLGYATSFSTVRAEKRKERR